jgi:hypothetical protein
MRWTVCRRRRAQSAPELTLRTQVRGEDPTGASASAESLLEVRGRPVSAIPAPKAAKPKAEPEPKATKPKAEPKPRKRATRKPKAPHKAEPGDGLVRP